MPPEITGAVQAFRVARPFLLAVASTLPVLAARAAANAGASADGGAFAASTLVVAGFVIFVLWLWQREKLQVVLQQVVNPTGGPR